ncbi:MAG: CoA ester lyase [Betaproteobacteria bacterium]|nr:CoA ester lyase [Betaproteobacteria bacterium]
MRALRRSKLFVPGNKPELMRKALRSQADSLSLDLEDAVPLAQKAHARAEVRAFLDDADCRDREIVVRVNSRDSGLLLADLMSTAPAQPNVVNIPKVESARDLQFADDVLTHLEHEYEIAPGSIRLMPTFESARGIRLAVEICQSSPRVVALQFGMGDLKASTGTASRPDILRSIRLQLVLAAAECGIDALDSAYPDFSDSAGFAADCAEARALGFRGKSCIHPSQVAMCNSSFLPSTDEIEDARALIQAYEEARSAGTGAINFKGRLVDEAHWLDARRLLACLAPH